MIISPEAQKNAQFFTHPLRPVAFHRASKKWASPFFLQTGTAYDLFFMYNKPKDLSWKWRQSIRINAELICAHRSGSQRSQPEKRYDENRIIKTDAWPLHMHSSSHSKRTHLLWFDTNALCPINISIIVFMKLISKHKYFIERKLVISCASTAAPFLNIFFVAVVNKWDFFCVTVLWRLHYN